MSESPEIKILIQQVSKIAESVDKLVQIDAAREERDKQQAKKNEEFEQFIKDNNEPLIRLRRWHTKVDKWGTAIGFAIIVAIATLLGFNFTK
jgi:hypothetical protein